MDLCSRFPKLIYIIPFVVINSRLRALQDQTSLFYISRKHICSNLIYINLESLSISCYLKLPWLVFSFEHIHCVFEPHKSFFESPIKLIQRNAMFWSNTHSLLSSDSCPFLFLLLTQTRIAVINIWLFPVGGTEQSVSPDTFIKQSSQHLLIIFV